EIPPPKDGRDGRDGKDGRDGVASKDELSALVREAVDTRVEQRIAEEKASWPRMEYREVWRDGEHYLLGNVVTWKGAAWHCQETGTKDRPGEGPGWVLMVKKGRDGRDAR